MKKLILAIVILVLLFIVVAGAVGFDYYKQNQRIETIQTKLDFISKLIDNGDTKTAQSSLYSVKQDLYDLSSRWISIRIAFADDRIYKFEAQIKKQVSPPSPSPTGLLPSQEEFNKTVKETIDSVNKNSSNKNSR